MPYETEQDFIVDLIEKPVSFTDLVHNRVGFSLRNGEIDFEFSYLDAQGLPSDQIYR